jgi:hypothetical protein
MDGRNNQRYLSIVEGDETFPINTRRQLQQYLLKLPEFPLAGGLVCPGISNVKCAEIVA